ncbi:T9SS type A sorting domain-containing protein [Chryseobacterium sp.]|uniref:T9SS type A sorting domain-containing protein n=1 Tax=Chryseobacterium sp. TaxID=1871047 RepID=UPI003219AD11
MRKLIYFFIFISVIDVKGQWYLGPDPNYSGGTPIWNIGEQVPHIFISDGSTLMANSGGTGSHNVWKKLPNGNRDLNFGVNGSIQVRVRQNNVLDCLVNEQNIYTFWESSSSSGYFITLKKYNASGQPDLSYGNNGSLIVNQAAIVGADQNSNVYIWSGNMYRRILADGQIDNSFLINDPYLRMQFSNNYIYIGGKRYDYNGNIDAGFTERPASIINRFSDESITFSHNLSTLTIKKYASNGLPDTNFGTNGTKTLNLTAFNSPEIYAADFDSAGNIVFFGGTHLPVSSGTYPSMRLLIRLKTNGDEDYTFNGNSFYYLEQNKGIILDGKIINNDKYLLFTKSRYTLGSYHINTDQLVRSSVLSTSEIENKAKWSVYPNPVQDVLTVQLDPHEKLQTIEIFDVTGKLIKKSSVLENNVAAFTQGTYVIVVKTDKKNYQTKFVKK